MQKSDFIRLTPVKLGKIMGKKCLRRHRPIISGPNACSKFPTGLCCSISKLERSNRLGLKIEVRFRILGHPVKSWEE